MGDDGGGSLTSWEGVAPNWTVGVSISLIFPYTIKFRRWLAKVRLLGITPWAAPHAYANRWGNAEQNAAQPYPKAEGCGHDDLRADKLRKGWRFRVGTWNADSLTGRAGELVEALADREVDVGCIQETRWIGSGCRFFGAQGKRYKLFRMGGKDSCVRQLNLML